MADLKTKASDPDVESHLATIEPPARQADARTLDQLFCRVTGFAPRLWGGSIVGYGRYRYTYDSGHSGETCATGFSARKANLVVYVLPGYADLDHLLARLGKHKLGKACLYLTRLSAIDLTVLEDIIRAGLADLSTRWEIHPD